MEDSKKSTLNGILNFITASLNISRNLHQRLHPFSKLDFKKKKFLNPAAIPFVVVTKGKVSKIFYFL